MTAMVLLYQVSDISIGRVHNGGSTLLYAKICIANDVHLRYNISILESMSPLSKGRLDEIWAHIGAAREYLNGFICIWG